MSNNTNTGNNSKIVLITGASSGIGYEMAKVFAGQGYNLVLVARRVESMDALADIYPNINIKVISKDLSLETSCLELGEELKDINIDILINNAGFGDVGEFEKLNLNKQSSMVNVNVRALAELTHIFGSKMVKRGSGKIMNVASVVAFMAGPYMATYFATKAFVLSFSQALSEEWSDKGVQVMTLCPGITQSGFQDVAGQIGSDIIKKSGNIPTANEVAQFGYNKLMAGKTLSVHGFANNIFTFLPRLLPRRLMLAIMAKALK